MYFVFLYSDLVFIYWCCFFVFVILYLRSKLVTIVVITGGDVENFKGIGWLWFTCAIFFINWIITIFLILTRIPIIAIIILNIVLNTNGECPDAPHLLISTGSVTR